MPKHHHRPSSAAGASVLKRIFSLPLIALLAVMAFAAVLAWYASRDTLPAEVDVQRAHQMYEQGAFFLDVRTQAEWNEAHIARSTLIPLDELVGRTEELPKGTDIVVVCRSGTRSREGASILREAGFTRVTCMTGGLKAWLAAGYPVVQ